MWDLNLCEILCEWLMQYMQVLDYGAVIIVNDFCKVNLEVVLLWSISKHPVFNLFIVLF